MVAMLLRSPVMPRTKNLLVAVCPCNAVFVILGIVLHDVCVSTVATALCKHRHFPSLAAVLHPLSAARCGEIRSA